MHISSLAKVIASKIRRKSKERSSPRRVSRQLVSVSERVRRSRSRRNRSRKSEFPHHGHMRQGRSPFAVSRWGTQKALPERRVSIRAPACRPRSRRAPSRRPGAPGWDATPCARRCRFLRHEVHVSARFAASCRPGGLGRPDEREHPHAPDGCREKVLQMIDDVPDNHTSNFRGSQGAVSQAQKAKIDTGPRRAPYGFDDRVIPTIRPPSRKPDATKIVAESPRRRRIGRATSRLSRYPSSNVMDAARLGSRSCFNISIASFNGTTLSADATHDICSSNRLASNALGNSASMSACTRW